MLYFNDCIGIKMKTFRLLFFFLPQMRCFYIYTFGLTQVRLKHLSGPPEVSQPLGSTECP